MSDETDNAAATKAKPTIEIVLDMVRTVLKEPGVAADDHFLARGGDSLKGAQLVHRFNECFNIEMDLADLFDQLNIAALADRVDQAITNVPVRAGARARPDVHAAEEGPLSGQQSAIWAAEQLEPGSGAYNVPGVFLFDRVIDAGPLRERLDSLVRRHPMLRCVLREASDGTRQVVRPAETATVDIERLELDLATKTSSEGRPTLIAALTDLVGQPLSPYKSTMRAQLVLVRFADREQHALALTVHHLFCDGWSWQLLLAELSGRRQPASSRHYLDFVRDQRQLLSGERGRTLSRFWSEYLEKRPMMALPSAIGAGDVSAPQRGSALTFHLEPEVVRGLLAFARRERATTNMVLLAAWMVLLWKISGVRDQCVAIAVNGRKPQDEDVVGCFVNTIAVRTPLRPHESFSACLTDVRQAQLAALAHADLPTDQLVRLANPGSTTMLAPTNFSFQAGVEPFTSFGGVPAYENEFLVDIDPAEPTFPLSVSVMEYAAEMIALVKYSTELFRPETVTGWFHEFLTLLEHIARDGGHSNLIELFGDEAAPTGAVALPDFTF
ncbi:condensation domain-containing protein [Actinomadura sp. 6K520]|uniref:condensation domain-containing protein n=1 Tax=Actinomadura sp. 6K520 TaxID=2530364 RepID=UPI00104DD97F|nr:condensation domain-containing protein [Actinomadura sp. 6K520]TDE32824.1 hypothetical protein E1289_14320 [Actinomadura sp. 6K520]